VPRQQSEKGVRLAVLTQQSPLQCMHACLHFGAHTFLTAVAAPLVRRLAPPWATLWESASAKMRLLRPRLRRCRCRWRNASF
jgi:hypothetical protein